MTPHVLVIGGGYAGVMAARTAADHRARVTMVDADGCHDFLPRLATVAAGTGPERDVAAPLSDLLHRIPVRADRIAAVDPVGQLATTAEGDRIAFDAMVLAVGAQVYPPVVPGLADHAWTLRSAGDALRVRQRIATVERLVVVGAGATGIQLAAEVSASRPGVSVTVIEVGERILPSLPSPMAARARAVLIGRGVDLRTGVGLTEVAPHGAILTDGTEAAGLVVWTGGCSGTGPSLLPDADVSDGRLVVDRCGQVPGHGPIFAAGDIAGHRGRGGRLLPQTAQVAVQAGRMAGANAVRVAEGRRPRPRTLRHLGWVLPLGAGQAVAQVGPITLTDPVTTRLAPLLHDAIDLRHLFTVGGLPAVADHRPAGLPSLRSGVPPAL